MPAWKPFISAPQLDAVVAYVKTLSPRFASERTEPIPLGEPVPSSPQSIAAGRQHYERLKCASCHGVGSTSEGVVASTFTDDWNRRIRAAPLDEPWNFRGGMTARDIVLRMKTGMNGTPMPSYSQSANDEALWHVANYVRSLARKPVWSMTGDEVITFYDALRRRALEQPVVRGEYLARTLGCPECHTPSREDGGPIESLAFAGGQRWYYGPYGTFVSANLTSDSATGLGSVTDQQIKGTITRGVRRDGTRMLPFPMPWTSYSNLNGDDLNAIVAFLRTLPPVPNRIPAPQRPNLFSYFWNKFQLLILGRDLPLIGYPGNAGSAGK